MKVVCKARGKSNTCTPPRSTNRYYYFISFLSDRTETNATCLPKTRKRRKYVVNRRYSRRQTRFKNFSALVYICTEWSLYGCSKVSSLWMIKTMFIYKKGMKVFYIRVKHGVV